MKIPGGWEGLPGVGGGEGAGTVSVGNLGRGGGAKYFFVFFGAEIPTKNSKIMVLNPECWSKSN